MAIVCASSESFVVHIDHEAHDSSGTNLQDISLGLRVLNLVSLYHILLHGCLETVDLSTEGSKESIQPS